MPRTPATLLHIGLLALFAFAGGFTAQMLKPTPVAAESLATVRSYTMDGQPEEVFYGEDGKPRIEIGAYTGGGERGQPMTGLYDNSGQLRLLLRLAGGSSSPVIVMKDSQGRDRLVMGLSFDAAQEPFLSVTDNSGAAKDVFGHYGGHP